MDGLIDVLDACTHCEVVLVGLLKGTSLIVIVKEPGILVEYTASHSKDIVEGRGALISGCENVRRNCLLTPPSEGCNLGHVVLVNDVQRFSYLVGGGPLVHRRGVRIPNH